MDRRGTPPAKAFFSLYEISLFNNFSNLAPIFLLSNMKPQVHKCVQSSLWRVNLSLWHWEISSRDRRYKYCTFIRSVSNITQSDFLVKIFLSRKNIQSRMTELRFMDSTHPLGKRSSTYYMPPTVMLDLVERSFKTGRDIFLLLLSFPHFSILSGVSCIEIWKMIALVYKNLVVLFLKEEWGEGVDKVKKGRSVITPTKWKWKEGESPSKYFMVLQVSWCSSKSSTLSLSLMGVCRVCSQTFPKAIRE